MSILAVVLTPLIQVQCPTPCFITRIMAYAIGLSIVAGTPEKQFDGQNGQLDGPNFTRPLSNPSAGAFLQSVQTKGVKCLSVSWILIGFSSILCSIPLLPASADSSVRCSYGHWFRNCRSMNIEERLFTKKSRQLCSSHWMVRMQKFGLGLIKTFASAPSNDCCIIALISS
jgi:hypothetical protein